MRVLKVYFEEGPEGYYINEISPEVTNDELDKLIERMKAHKFKYIRHEVLEMTREEYFGIPATETAYVIAKDTGVANDA